MKGDLLKTGVAEAKYRLTYHQPRALILLYHGVTETTSDPWRLHVAPARFAEHLEVIRRCARVLSLAELVAGLQTGKLPRRSVVLTFDDGYAGNLTQAKPLLEKYDVPATVFVVTDCIGSDDEFWSDELERCLLHPNRLPETLSLQVNGRRDSWPLGAAAVYRREDFEQHQRWSAWTPGEPTRRHELYRELYRLLQPLPANRQRELLADLKRQARGATGTRSSHRFLTSAELVALAADGLIEIGSHTATHPVLPALPIAEQRREIAVSKRLLEELLGRPVNSFAYPYGRYSPASITAAREAGVRYACAADIRPTRLGEDIFALPRCIVQDWSGEEMEQRLAYWLRQ